MVTSEKMTGEQSFILNDNSEIKPVAGMNSPQWMKDSLHHGEGDVKYKMNLL